MADRSWYYAAQGQQQGPISEDQLHGLIARGVVTGETLVWSDGMAGWEKAGRVPGLMSDIGGYPPGMPTASNDMAYGNDAAYGYDAVPGGEPAALSAKLGVWALLGRAILMGIGEFLVIPTPWVAVYFYRYIAQNIRVPGRPNLSFIGQPMEIWYVFMGIGALIYINMIDSGFVKLAVLLANGFLGWMIVRWGVSRLASNGQPLPIRFEGSVIGYFGWFLLMIVSAFTIVGWAWALTAWMRWTCRNIQGTRREVVFTGTGLEVLWRTIVFVLGCCVIIPIPWVMRWYTQWYISQFGLVQRSA